MLWKTINSIIKLKKSRTSNEILQLKDNENGIIENLHDISNEFNNYFSSLGKNMANKINQPNNNNTYKSNIHIKSSKNSFFLHLISIKEVLIELQNSDPSKSAPSYNPPVKYIYLIF